MSTRTAFESKLNEMTPSLATEWENTTFSPANGVPYQTVNLLQNNPVDTTIANETYLEQGIFQVTLKYPTNKGMKDIETRANLVREFFKKGTILTDGSNSIYITQTPSITNLGKYGDRHLIVISINYFTPQEV